MRISTNLLHDAGLYGVQSNHASLYKLQNQLSTGRRVLTPEDDPVAAAQALVVTQTKGVVTQHLENQSAARSQLALVEGTLSSVGDLLQDVRERVIQAGNSTLTYNDRSYIATELESRYQDLLGLANTSDGAGQFMFSGYQGAVRPFVETSIAGFPVSADPVRYNGDDGERLLQVGPSRQIATNLSGNDIFMNIKSGNGTFTTGVGGNDGGGTILPPNSAYNQGTALIDAGSVLDPGLWQSAADIHGSLRIEFSVVGTTTTYQIYDAANQALLATPATFVPGQAIELEQTQTNPPLTTDPAKFGAQVTVSGEPADGDTFTIAPSAAQSVFQTINNLIRLLRQPVGAAPVSVTEYTNRLGAELTNLDRGLDSINGGRADVGARLKELDSLTSLSSDLEVQHSATLSELEDLDYAAAISDFTRKQLQLEAAQKSFAQISRLSLFDIL